MAISFASLRFMRRRAGHSVIERLAYIGRLRLTSTRSGETFDYSNRGDLWGEVVTLLPAGGSQQLAQAAALWSAVDEAATHQHAKLGAELILALPAPRELEPELWRRLVKDFIAETILPHRLAVSYAIHQPHRDLDPAVLAEDVLRTTKERSKDMFAEDLRAGLLHVHAHVMITPRQVGPSGLAPKRYVGLDPIVKGMATLDALDWRRLWTAHQNRCFAEQGLKLRVRPQAPLSAPGVPLHSVRRRRRRLRADPELDGRDLLVSSRLEQLNAEALRSFEQALQQFEQPFTRSELLSLLSRYLGLEEAEEQASATIGLGGAIELGDGAHGGSRWLTSSDLVTAELAAIGRAAVLAARSRPPLSAGDLREGHGGQMRAVLAAIAGGPDLIVIDAHHDPTNLLEDLARLAERGGLVPVSIAHGAGSRHPRAVIVGTTKLPTKPITGATLIVDQADALRAVELDLVLQSALAGNNRLVLVRRPGGMWPRNHLLDVISKRALRLAWGEPVQRTWQDLMRHGDVAAAVEMLAGAGRILAVEDAPGVAEAAVSWASARRVEEARGAVILAFGPGRLAELNRALEAAGVRVSAVDRLPAAGFAGAVLALPAPPASRGPMLAAQLARVADLTLLIDRERTPTNADLVAQLLLDLPTATATIHGVAPRHLTGSAWPPRPAVTDPALPRFGVNAHEEVVASPAAVRNCIAFWASAPSSLNWAAGFQLGAAAVLAALEATDPDGLGAEARKPAGADPPAGPQPQGMPEPGTDRSALAAADEPGIGPAPATLEPSLEASDDIRPDDLPPDDDREDDPDPDRSPDDDPVDEEPDWDGDPGELDPDDDPEPDDEGGLGA